MDITGLPLPIMLVKSEENKHFSKRGISLGKRTLISS